MDETLRRNFYYKVVKYIENNGEEYDENKVILREKNRVVNIAKWDYSIPRPNNVQLLAIDADDVKQREVLKSSLKNVCFDVLTQTEIDTLRPKNGLIVINSTLGRVQYYFNNIWNSF